MRKSIVLLEVIFTIVLLSIIFLTTTKFLLQIIQTNKTTYTLNLTKIEFETTKLFLISILEKESSLNNIKYLDNKLYYNNNLLQENVTKYEVSSLNNIYTINICINLYDDICQTWIIK